jgi:hypothetical protein
MQNIIRSNPIKNYSEFAFNKIKIARIEINSHICCIMID